MNEYIELACMEGDNGQTNGDGGPFGAVIVDKDGNVISKGHNSVLKNNDPTAHAEIVAIRNACNNLKTYDLSGCVIYSSCEPCPMCLSAIIWSNIKCIYYGATRFDAEIAGFRDSDIYDFIKGNNNMIDVHYVNSDNCKKSLRNYKGSIY